MLKNISVNSYHPEDCGFCEYPAEKLINAVSDFMEWAEPPTRMGDATALRPEVEAFLALTHEEQKEEVRRAQGYLDADGEG